MEQGLVRLLRQEKRRRRLMFGALTLGVALVAISSRSERAIFQGGTPLPGVFATIGTNLGERPQISLRDRDPSAFFARLDRDVAAQERMADPGVPPLPGESILLFAGPGGELPASGLIAMEPMDDVGPQFAYGPLSSPVYEPGEAPYFPPRRTAPNDNPTGTNPPPPGDQTPPNDTNPPVPPPVTAVPEPDTWALMLIGFAALGHALRRRSISSRPAFLPSR